MTECKRNGCAHEAEYRPRYEGFCSLQCRDYHDYETELEAYNTAWRELREWTTEKATYFRHQAYYGGGVTNDDMANLFEDLMHRLQELEKSHVLD